MSVHWAVLWASWHYNVLCEHIPVQRLERKLLFAIFYTLDLPRRSWGRHLQRVHSSHSLSVGTPVVVKTDELDSNINRFLTVNQRSNDDRWVIARLISFQRKEIEVYIFIELKLKWMSFCLCNCMKKIWL